LSSHPYSGIGKAKKAWFAKQAFSTSENGIIAMLATVNADSIVDKIASSYEIGIQGIEAFLETTHQLFRGFQDLVFDTTQEREGINDQLRENLAKTGSLRRKDFNNMMSAISSQQDRQEREVRDLSKNYLNEQTSLARQLRENLRNFRESLTRGESQRAKEFQTVIRAVLATQEKRKQEVISKLKEFQKEQQETAKMLKNLLAKGRELRIKDLKLMLAEFKTQHEERVARRKERREEVRSMLGDFKKERAEVAQRSGRI
jgi:vacuolar-type H+-ATPase subunit I/STV1